MVSCLAGDENQCASYGGKGKPRGFASGRSGKVAIKIRSLVIPSHFNLSLEITRDPNNSQDKPSTYSSALQTAHLFRVT